MSNDNYDVGYGKPPKSGRFKKGKSGNPKGRPKKTFSLNETVKRSAAKKIAIKTQNGIKRVDQLTALVEGTIHAALKGDARARSESFKLLRDIDLDAELRAKTVEKIQTLDEADLNILARLQSKQSNTTNE